MAQQPESSGKTARSNAASATAASAANASDQSPTPQSTNAGSSTASPKTGQPVTGRRLSLQKFMLPYPLDGVQEHGIAENVVDAKSHQHGDRMWRRDIGFLKRLKALEFGHRGVASDGSPDPLQTRGRARIKLDVIPFARVLEAPYLSIPAIFNQRPHATEVLEGCFQFLQRHGGVYSRKGPICRERRIETRRLGEHGEDGFTAETQRTQREDQREDQSVEIEIVTSV